MFFDTFEESYLPQLILKKSDGALAWIALTGNRVKLLKTIEPMFHKRIF